MDRGVIVVNSPCDQGGGSSLISLFSTLVAAPTIYLCGIGPSLAVYWLKGLSQDSSLRVSNLVLIHSYKRFDLI